MKIIPIRPKDRAKDDGDPVQDFPELRGLDIIELRGLKKHNSWRLDCFHLIQISRFKWFERSPDVEAYHRDELEKELNFIVQLNQAIDKRLAQLGC